MGRGYRNATDGDIESVASFAAIFTKSVYCSVGKDERKRNKVGASTSCF